jgi:hypothetical protein
VHELDGARRGDDRLPHERVDDPGGLGPLDLREACRPCQPVDRPQDGQRAGEPYGPGSQHGEAGEHGPGDGLRAEVRHPLRLGRHRPYAVAPQAGEDLGEQKGVTAARMGAGPAEGVVGGVRHPRAYQPAHGLLAERAQAEDLGLDSAERAGQAGAGRTRAAGEQQEDGQVPDAPRQVGDEPQRRLVGPVHVVDGEQEGAALGQVGTHPVEPVDHAAHGGLRTATQAEHRCGEGGRAGQQVRLAGPRIRLGGLRRGLAGSQYGFARP